MLSRIKFFLLGSAIAVAVSACGGGGGGSDDTTKLLTPKPDEAYTGNRNPALLTDINTPVFASIIIGQSSSTDLIPKGESHSAPVLTNQSRLIENLIQATQQSTSPGTLQARSISETEACEFGGNIAVSGEVNDSTETGVLIYSFNNCKMESTTTVNGQASQTIISSYDPISNTLAYDGLELSQGTESFLLTGTIDYTSAESIRDDGNEEITATQVTNLTTTHSPSGVMSYLKDYTLTDYISYNEKAQSTSGQVYLSTEGYTTVSTSSEYLTGTNSSIPTQGYLFMTGASLSKGRISEAAQSESNLKYRLDLDTDGDSAFELTSLQDSASLTTDDLEINQAPVAIIDIEHNDGDYDYDSHSDERHYTLGTSFYLDSNSSYDSDDTDLSFTWTVEESPEGSSAQLVQYDDIGPFIGEISQKIRFTPDLKGDYKVSLKATDSNGSQQSNVDFINISTANLPPALELETYYDSPVEARVGTSFDFGLVATDEDTLEGQPEIVVSYVWLEKPEGSEAQLINTWESISTDTFEQNLRQSYSISFDEEGTYKAQFTVTDSEGATTSSIFEAEVRTAGILNSDISCAYDSDVEDTCDWSTGTINIDTSTTIGFPIDDSFFHSCEWKVTSSVVDSTGTPEVFSSPYSVLITFNPGLLGEYILEIECLHSYDFVTTSYFSSAFNVVN